MPDPLLPGEWELTWLKQAEEKKIDWGGGQKDEREPCERRREKKLKRGWWRG